MRFRTGDYFEENQREMMDGDDGFDFESRVTAEQFAAELTDPKYHNPKNFCYIVHGINPAAHNNLMLLAMKNGGYDFKQEIDLLENPERISEKKVISSSVISENHLTTWGNVFFILDVPWENHVSMQPRDQGTNVTRPDFVLEHARSPYTTPRKLIEQGNTGLNELVVTGKKNGNAIKIAGVGIKKYTDNGEIMSPEEAARMREIAKELGVPLIEFEVNEKIEDSPPEVNHNYSGEEGNLPVRSVFVNKGGYRYCFEAGWDEIPKFEIFKSDKNRRRGYNKISKAEYLELRTELASRLKSPKELEFLDRLDKEMEM